MSEAKPKTNGAAGNTGVSVHGDRDRVAMLSLNADGTPDQTSPQLIGDRQLALDGTREQFRQQAVSAVDQEKRALLFGVGSTGEQLEQDPTIAELQTAHQAAEQAADSAADATVGALFTDDPALTAGDVDRKPASGSK
jgi:hypothetical protein